MSRVILWLRRVTLAALIMVLPATSLGIPSAQAADGLNMKGVSVFRIETTDQLYIINDSNAVAQFDYVDPHYQAQSVTLSPGTDNSSAPMCAISKEQNPNSTVYVTFNPGTPEAVSTVTSYFSMGGEVGDLQAHEQAVIKAEAAVAKVKSRVIKAKAAVKEARQVLAKAKASHRTGWIVSSKRWLGKTQARVVALKARLQQKKGILANVRRELRDFQEAASYCKSR